MSPSLPLLRRRRSRRTMRSFRSLDSINKLRNIDSKLLLDQMRVSIKSQFGVEFRRFSLAVGTCIPYPTIEEFAQMIYKVHMLTTEQKNTLTLSYISKDGTILPISNDDNLRKALEGRPTTLKVLVRHKGESLEEEFGYGVDSSTVERRKKTVSISAPQDFRMVSSILDADTLPLELLRVQLCKSYSNKPLGFFIRDGSSLRLTQWGPVPVPGIFISRLLPHGLAASTNLLNINDEVLEVNGINISGKTLDQVTDIMTANSANLILTTRPAVCRPYSYYPYSPPPYSMPAPGYGALMPMHGPIPSPPPQQPFYSNLAIHTGENMQEDRFNKIPSPLHWGTFSRESTFRLSDKMSKMSVKDSRRRPFSIHCPPAHHLYPTSPYSYGY